MSGRSALQLKPEGSWSPPGSALLQRKCACGTHMPGGGECASCRGGSEPGALQRAQTGRGGPAGGMPAVVHEVLISPGQRLDEGTRSFMESRFGHDFSAVRVHSDSKAAESARAVQARAYTVGRDVVFGAGQYSGGDGGRRLLAHELAHVVQQQGAATGLQPSAMTESDHPTEREADLAAEAVMSGRQARVSLKASGAMLQRDKDDLVAYSGGQSGSITVVKARKVIYSTSSSVSGHPGHGVDEPSQGPIPDGRYKMHPAITQAPVTALQSGVCGADPISRGYQEITSTDKSPCSGAHYCNVPCPTPTEPLRMCFTPQDCWGPKRIKIEGSARVASGGKVVRRDGFYLHGGNPKDAVSSGCVKALTNDVFAEIRKLKGEVPFCVGSGCPPWLPAAIGAAAVEAVKDAAVETARSIGRSLGGPFGL